MLEAWRAFHCEAAFWLPESTMMHLLFGCNLGKRDDLVNSAAPFQFSNFFSTLLGFSLQGPALAVPLHLRKRELSSSESQAEIQETRKCVPSVCWEWLMDRILVIGWDLLEVAKQGRRMLGSWLRSSPRTKMQAENLKYVLKWLLKLMQHLQGMFSTSAVTQTN